MSEVVLSYLGQIDSLEKSVISSSKLSNHCGFLMYKIGELLLSWASISGVEFNSKIFSKTSRVMTSGQQNSSQTIS